MTSMGTVEKKIKKQDSRVRVESDRYSFSYNLKQVTPQGWGLLVLLTTLWAYIFPYETKLESIVCSVTYSFLEWSWYTFTVEENGIVMIAPLSKTGRKGFTSFEQCMANILSLPLLTHGYLLAFPVNTYTEVRCISMIILRILFFPFAIWGMEIMQDKVMKFMMGFNPAWDYSASPGSRFDGAINLYHWKLWVTLGIIASTCNATVGCTILILGFSSIHVVKYFARRRLVP